MKKLLTLLLAMSLVLTSAFLFSACNGSTEKTDGGENAGDSENADTETITAGNGKTYTYPKEYMVVTNNDQMLMLTNVTTKESITIAFSPAQYDAEGFDFSDECYKDEEEFKLTMENSSLGLTVEDIILTQTDNSQTILYKATEILGEVTYRAYRMEATVVGDKVALTTYTITETNEDHADAKLIFSKS